MVLGGLGMVNFMDPATQFLLAAWLTMYADLIFARWLKFRFKLITQTQPERVQVWEERLKKIKKLHIHHFNYGLALLPFVLLALYYDFPYAPGMAGIMTSLIGTEAYNLITMRWGP